MLSTVDAAKSVQRGLTVDLAGRRGPGQVLCPGGGIGSISGRPSTCSRLTAKGSPWAWLPLALTVMAESASGQAWLQAWSEVDLGPPPGELSASLSRPASGHFARRLRCKRAYPSSTLPAGRGTPPCRALLGLASEEAGFHEGPGGRPPHPRVDAAVALETGRCLSSPLLGAPQLPQEPEEPSQSGLAVQASSVVAPAALRGQWPWLLHRCSRAPSVWLGRCPRAAGPQEPAFKHPRVSTQSS